MNVMDGDDELFVQPTDPGQLYDGQEFVSEEQAKQVQKQDEEEENDGVVMPKSAPPITTALSLPFQQKIVSDMLAEDGLLVLARGLGLLRITVNLIHCLDVIGTDQISSQNSLILVVGASDDDNDKIREGLRELSTIDGLNSLDVGEGTAALPRRRRGLTVFSESTTTKQKREKAYTQGGVFSVSSVVLVNDMLSGTVDRKMVTGIVVLNAHRVKEDSAPAFALNLFRDQNKQGFIKALSDQPERFSTGFSALSKHLKWLRVRRLWLWPRFHVKVRGALDSNRDVVEVAVFPTDAMDDIGKDLRGIMESCLSELRQLNIVKQNVENANDNWTLDNAILKNFTGMVRAALGSVWHQMKGKNRQLIYDIGELLQLLERSTGASSVNFLKDLTCMHRIGQISLMKGLSSWIDHPAADHLMKAAKQRVFDKKGGVEEPPKWDQLGKILEEIAIAQQHRKGGEMNGPVLIMCGSFENEIRTAISRLRNVDGVFTAQQFLVHKRNEYKTWQKSLVGVSALYRSGQTMQQISAVANQPKPIQLQMTEQRSGFAKRRRVRGGSAAAAAANPTPRQATQPPPRQTGPDATPFDIVDVDEVEDEAEEEDDMEVEVVDELSQQVQSQVMDMGDLVLVQKFDETNDEQLLEELQPSYIIIYEPDLAFIRRVEEYRYGHTARVFFMYYKDSVEEQRFLAAVRREKDTFTNLIREKAKMPILMEDEETHGPEFFRAVSSRIAGGQTIETEPPRVIVDTRELKSSLPFQIYKQKCEVYPSVLTVGDYVLTPDICVERKSINDLVQSLNSGRLYKQCVEMNKFYDLPTLLVEFDEAKAFSSLSMDENERMRNSDMEKFQQDTVQSKLALLFLTFPKLRIIWSSSPHQTAEIFMDLKQARLEPSLDTAMGYGRRGNNNNNETENDEAIAMLQSIPGINHENYGKIINKVKNLKEFCMMSEPDLAKIIGKPSAARVSEFLRTQSGK